MSDPVLHPAKHRVHPSEAFVFQDGTRAHTLAELLDKVRSLSDHDFGYFVTDQKHDFASWIGFAFKNRSLENDVSGANTKSSLIAILDEYLMSDSAAQQPISHEHLPDAAYQPPGNEQDGYEPPRELPRELPREQPREQPKQQFQSQPPRESFSQRPREPSYAQNQEPQMPVEAQVASQKQPYHRPAPTPPPEHRAEPSPFDDLTGSFSKSRDETYQPKQQYQSQNQQSFQQQNQEQSQQQYQQQNSQKYSNQSQAPKIDSSMLNAEMNGDTSESHSNDQERPQREMQETTKEQFRPQAKPHIDSEELKREARKDTKPEEDMMTEEEARFYADLMVKLQREINRVFIGQEDSVKRVIITLMCEAHSLLEGVPGLAKSLLVETLTKTVDGTTFNRIQFMPDLLPADVIGGQIYNPKTASFTTLKGPIFANFVLADEINRAPPKTHSALMEAMQEKKVNIDVEEYILDRPFLVISTQNPLENKGTYVLPEAVLDRFMFKIDLPYPARKDEKTIISENATVHANLTKKINYVLTKAQFIKLQQRVKRVYLSDRIKEYILDVVEATRGLNPKIEGKQFIQYGAGPRASIYLGIGAKAHAVTQGRNYVMPEDVIYVAPDILRHRVILNFKGKAHNISSDKIIEEILTKINAL